jgi:hypothetical protein
MANEHERYPRPLRWAHEEPHVPAAWTQLSVIVPSSVKHELTELARNQRRTLSKQCWELLARGLAQEQTVKKVAGNVR